MTESPSERELVQALLEMHGLDVPSDEVDALASTFGDARAMVERLRGLDLSGVAPAVVFDPRGGE